jgi:hypothetical protein
MFFRFRVSGDKGDKEEGEDKGEKAQFLVTPFGLREHFLKNIHLKGSEYALRAAHTEFRVRRKGVLG